MPIAALEAVSVARNGVGAFITQCKRVDIHYSNWGGSSRGMKALIKSPLLTQFAAAHPQIQFQLSPCGNDHPSVKAHYIDGPERDICVKNLEKEQIMKHIENLSEKNGQRDRKVTGGRKVESLNQGVRGIWDELHTTEQVEANTLQKNLEKEAKSLFGRKKKQK